MKRKTIKIADVNISVSQLLEWAKQFEVFTLLNSNPGNGNPNDQYSKFDLLLAVDPVQIYTGYENAFDLLKEIQKTNDWHILHLSYDLKNKIENLQSNNEDKTGLPDYLFYCPAIVFEIKNRQLQVNFFEEKISETEIKSIVQNIASSSLITAYDHSEIAVHSKISREEYIVTFNAIKEHIQLGDIYEMNYCQEFYSEGNEVDPVSVYLKLNSLSPMPFSIFSKYREHYLLSSSPERYLAKRGSKIISQPIKGTSRRGTSPEEDKIILDKLYNDPKERSENVMIVDIVRNDLSRTAKRSSVNVEELFGIKTYRQLHQMTSTIVSELDQKFDLSDVIKTSFPMGSMTGAPKIRAMEIIEESEKTKRGWYSGTVGYLSPEGDCDLNVVIRSIIYNSKNKYLSFMTGSAITIGAEAEKEYDECLLKAAAMKKSLQNFS